MLIGRLPYGVAAARMKYRLPYIKLCSCGTVGSASDSGLKDLAEQATARAEDGEGNDKDKKIRL